VSGILVLSGALMLLAALRRGAARVYRGLGLFLGCVGVTSSLHLPLLRGLMVSSSDTLLKIHEMASLLYPIGFADFALGLFGDGRRRVLSRGLRVYAIYAAPGAVLALVAPLVFPRFRAPINAFML